MSTIGILRLGTENKLLMCDGCDGHSRQPLRTVDKVLRQSQKETQRIKDLLQEKWKKPVVCLKDLPQLKIEYPRLRIYQETTESLKQRENNNKQKLNVYIL